MNIAHVFEETAMNECEHAKIFLKLLEAEGTEPGNISFQLTIPAVVIGETLDNLRTAAKGENEEHTIGYPHMAAIAEQEGFTDIAKKLRRIAEIEREHEIRFTIIADQLENGTLFKKEKYTKSKCRNCGAVSEGEKVPEVCPVCSHQIGFFEIKEDLE
jgi:rubrerythrin